MLQKINLLFLSFLILLSTNGQTISRDPEPRKDYANVFYKTEYTLFDLWSDEPIFPSSNGIFEIYYATNEEKTPKKLTGTPSEIARSTVYKFKNYDNCLNWCKGVAYTKSVNRAPVNNTEQKSVVTSLIPNSDKLSSLNDIRNYVQLLGSKSDKEISSYNLKYVHQAFDFNENPLAVTEQEPNASYGKPYSQEEKKKLEDLLRGLEKLKYDSIILTDSLKRYGNCLSNGCPEKIALYKALTESYQIIDLGDLWATYSKKIEKSCDWTPEEMQHLNGRFFRTNIKQEDYDYSYHPVNELNINPIRVDKKSKHLYKILNKVIDKNPNVIVSDNKKDFIKTHSGLDEVFFNLTAEREKVKEIITTVEKNYFIPLKPQKYYEGKLQYVGSSINGVPEGFGYLLNQKKQLMLAAHWNEGFPTILYNVNIYLDPETESLYYSYKGENKHANKYISLIPLKYKESGHNTYDLYIGEFKYNQAENINERSGSGCYFFNSWTKTNLQYYKGEWANGKRNGQGIHNDNGTIYNGDYSNGNLIKGTCTWLDKGVYTGEFKEYRMHGMGKKINADGSVLEGLFENGSFSKTLAQLEEEKKQKEQEEIRQNELMLAKEKNQSNNNEGVLSERIFDKVFATLTPSEQAYLDKVLNSNDDPKNIVGNRCGKAFSKCKWCGRTISFDKTWASKIRSIKAFKDPFTSLLGNLFAGIGLTLGGVNKVEAVENWSRDLKNNLVEIRSGNIYFCSEPTPPKYCSKKCEVESSFRY